MIPPSSGITKPGTLGFATSASESDVMFWLGYVPRATTIRPGMRWRASNGPTSTPKLTKVNKRDPQGLVQLRHREIHTDTSLDDQSLLTHSIEQLDHFCISTFKHGIVAILIQCLSRPS